MCAGALVHWCAGALVALGRWGAGALGRWGAGALGRSWGALGPLKRPRALGALGGALGRWARLGRSGFWRSVWAAL